MRRSVGIILLGISVVTWGCTNKSQPQQEVSQETVQDTAQYLVDQMIAYHGGDVYPQSSISFVFRGRRYEAVKRKDTFTYQRRYADSVKGEIYDVLTNDGFIRKINGEEVSLTEKQYTNYANSLNSVIYFAYLPYGLNDPAVKKEYLGKVSIHDHPLEKIKVTFSQEGGGDDYDDVYVYWLDAETRQLRYLAYLFHVNDGGLRFRVGKNIRRVENILFADYTNYKGDMNQYSVYELDRLFEEGKLDSLSQINLENIQVSLP